MVAAFNRRAFLVGAAAFAAAAVTRAAVGDAVDVLPVVYGRARVEGLPILRRVTGIDQEYLHIVTALAPHPIRSVEAVFLDDWHVPFWRRDDRPDGTAAAGRYANLVRIRAHLGDADQMADDDLIAEFPDMFDERTRAPGLAYHYLRLRWCPSVFAQGVPPIATTLVGERGAGLVRGWA